MSGVLDSPSPRESLRQAVVPIEAPAAGYSDLLALLRARFIDGFHLI
jgi:hypothetical protein